MEDNKALETRKNTIIGMVAVGIVAAIVIIVVVLLVAGRKNYRPVAVSSFTGEATIGKEDGTINAKKDMKLIPGDDVKTKDASEVVLLIDTDKKVTVSENSKVEIIAEGNAVEGCVTVQVYYGKVEVDITGELQPGDKFRVKTGNAMVSARDHRFVVSYDKDKDKTFVESCEASVEVSDVNRDDKVVLTVSQNAVVTSNGIGIEIEE